MKEKSIWKRLFLQKRSILLVTGLLAVLLLEIAKRNSYFAEEIFAKRIFKGISLCISFLTGWIPFSLAECSILLCPFLLLGICIAWIRIYKKKRDTFFLFLNSIYSIACIVSFIFFVYAIGCGINYYRYPFSYYAELTVEPSDAETLYALCIDLAKQANTLRNQLKTEDENGVYELPFSTKELAEQAKEAYEQLAEQYPILAGNYPAPKSVWLSKYMSYTRLTGIYTCWTMEANVNIDIPEYSIGSTMTHELAHLRGFIREDEANYLAYLACMASNSPDLQYSGTMLALILSGNALYRKNPDLYAGLRATYSDGIVRDMVANSAYWEKYQETVIGETASKANDAYLKANNQTDGVESYGRMVDLLLASYKKNKESK